MLLKKCNCDGYRKINLVNLDFVINIRETMLYFQKSLGSGRPMKFANIRDKSYYNKGFQNSGVAVVRASPPLGPSLHTTPYAFSLYLDTHTFTCMCISIGAVVLFDIRFFTRQVFIFLCYSEFSGVLNSAFKEGCKHC